MNIISNTEMSIDGNLKTIISLNEIIKKDKAKFTRMAEEFTYNENKNLIKAVLTPEDNIIEEKREMKSYPVGNFSIDLNQNLEIELIFNNAKPRISKDLIRRMQWARDHEGEPYPYDY